jgi:ankyrin repeat protein
LHFAVLADQVDVVRLLLSHKVNVNSRTSDGHMTLHLAAQIGDKLLITLLVEHGASVDAKDQTLLHHSV